MRKPWFERFFYDRIVCGIGGWIDELLFGERYAREVSWVIGVLLVAIVVVLAWQIARS